VLSANFINACCPSGNHFPSLLTIKLAIIYNSIHQKHPGTPIGQFTLNFCLFNIALQIKVPTYALYLRPLNTFRELICSFNVSKMLAKQHQSHESLGPCGGDECLCGGVRGRLAKACGQAAAGVRHCLATFLADLFFYAVLQEPLTAHRPKRDQHPGC
jgi:hypothetical protein